MLMLSIHLIYGTILCDAVPLKSSTLSSLVPPLSPHLSPLSSLAPSSSSSSLFPRPSSLLPAHSSLSLCSNTLGGIGRVLLVCRQCAASDDIELMYHTAIPISYSSRIAISIVKCHSALSFHQCLFCPHLYYCCCCYYYLYCYYCCYFSCFVSFSFSSRRCKGQLSWEISVGQRHIVTRKTN